tara:strand:+ start:73 stop:684 length:612 start_codon:yes stop_codon:yes gene_type:complete
MINFKLILDSILSPKLVFQKVLNYEIKPSILIEAVLFISIINALFTYTSNYLIYSNGQPDESIFMLYYENILKKPILLVFLEVLKIFIITSLATYIGKFFGGKGTFISLLKCVAWIHYILLFINILLFVLIILNLYIASYLIMLTNIWIIWALSECAARAHGFSSTFLVFVTGIFILLLFIVFLLQILNSSEFILLEKVGSNA